MKYLYILLLVFVLCCEQSHHNTVALDTVELPDLDAIWTDYDSIDANGLHGVLANKLYCANQGLRSSEMYTTAAWLYGKANMGDSALICIDQSIDHGMVNPNILTKHELERFGKTTSLRIGIDHKLENIAEKLSNLDNFEIDTEPIYSFWKYFNLALADTLNAKKHLKDYIFKGSNAIKDYYMIRYGNIDNMYQQMIIKTPEHYSHTQSLLTKEKLSALKNETSRMMHVLSEIYPRAVFPKVYIMPGLINSGGTATEIGMFIGGEMFVKSEDMATKGLNEWQKGAISTTEEMKGTIMHELMHFQQSYHDSEKMETVIGNIIQEGVCDFLVELCSDSELENDNLKYLDDPKNLEFILSELKQDMYSKDLSKWLYNGMGIEDRPHDLGYTLGYKICKSYYQRSVDKKDAIIELLNTDNFEDILKGSEYAFIL